MQEGFKRQDLSERVEMLSEQGNLMKVLQTIGLKYKASLDLRSGFLIKSLQNSQNLVVIGFITLNLRREKVQIHKIESQLVENAVKSTMVISLRVTDNCFSCGKSGHNMRDFHNLKSQDKGSA